MCMVVIVSTRLTLIPHASGDSDTPRSGRLGDFIGGRPPLPLPALPPIRLPGLLFFFFFFITLEPTVE